MYLYHEHANIAAAGVDTWTYTNSTGSTIHLEQILSSASGELKVTLLTGPGGSETTKAVVFTTKGSLIANVPFSEPLTVLNGQNILITVKNTDKGSMDIHSFINGFYE